MPVSKGLMIDYEFCLGCSECETACMTEHDYNSDKMGIKVIKMGPWRTKGDGWQYDFVPLPTDWCDLCVGRLNKGSRPACVRRCQYGVLTYGSVDELTSYFKAKSKMILFTPKCSDEM